MSQKSIQPVTEISAGRDDGENWFALWIRSRHEQVVREQLEQKRIETFLPTVTRWSRWKDRKKKIDWPLFPGYCFARFDPRAVQRLLCRSAAQAHRVIAILAADLLQRTRFYEIIDGEDGVAAVDSTIGNDLQHGFQAAAGKGKHRSDLGLNDFAGKHMLRQGGGGRSDHGLIGLQNGRIHNAVESGVRHSSLLVRSRPESLD